MSPNTEPPSQNDLFHPQGQHPKLRRLASKPLKLAQSTLRPLTSRSSTTPGQSTVASSSTLVPSDATSINSYSSGSDRKKWRRHHRLKSQPGLTPAQIASAAKGPRKPLDGEEPAAWLRVRIVRADGLVAKDRRGSSDP